MYVAYVNYFIIIIYNKFETPVYF